MKITLELRKKILIEALRLLKKGTFRCLCDNITEAGYNVFGIKYAYDEIGYRKPLHIIGFNYQNVYKLCKENKLPLPKKPQYGRDFWWDIDDKKTRIKVLELLIKQ